MRRLIHQFQGVSSLSGCFTTARLFHHCLAVSLLSGCSITVRLFHRCQDVSSRVFAQDVSSRVCSGCFMTPRAEG